MCPAHEFQLWARDGNEYPGWVDDGVELEMKPLRAAIGAFDLRQSLANVSDPTTYSLKYLKATGYDVTLALSLPVRLLKSVWKR